MYGARLLVRQRGTAADRLSPNVLACGVASRTVVGPLDVLGLAVGGAPAAEGLEGSAAKA